MKYAHEKTYNNSLGHSIPTIPPRCLTFLENQRIGLHVKFQSELQDPEAPLEYSQIQSKTTPQHTNMTKKSMVTGPVLVILIIIGTILLGHFIISAISSA